MHEKFSIGEKQNFEISCLEDMVTYGFLSRWEGGELLSLKNSTLPIKHQFR